MRIDNPSISGSLSFIGGTNSISATSVSLTGSLSGTFEGAFSGDSLTNISGAFDSVSASLAAERLKNTTDTLTGDLTVTGKITAQEFHTEFVSASIIYESGSTQFGNSADDTHVFTGTGSFDKVGIGTETPQAPLHIWDGDNGIILGNPLFNTSIQFKEIDGGLTLTQVDEFGSGDIFRVDINGNVGIGVNTPTAKLHINQPNHNEDTIGYASSTALWRLRNETVSGNPTGRLSLYDNGTATVNIEGSAGRVTYFNAGNVGIGVTTPSAKLQVDGSVKVTNSNLSFDKDNTASGGDYSFINIGYNGSWSNNANGLAAIEVNDGGGVVGKFGISYDGASNGYFVVRDLYNSSGYAGSGDVFYVKGNGVAVFSGNIGIGETTPGHKLDIKGSDAYLVNINNTATDARLQFERNGTAYGHMSAGADLFTMYGNPGTSLRFMPGGSTAMYIQAADGNVGIGTTSATQKLHVEGSGIFGTSVYRSSLDGGGAGAYLRYGTPADPDSLGTIGTYSSAMMYETAQSGGHVFSTGAGVNGTERVRINNDGNVGVGTNNPTSKLHINGSSAHIQFTGTNNRITFSGYRAVEGSHDGATLQLGEGYSKTVMYGSVGIGTTVPTHTLEVNGPTKSSYFTSNINTTKSGLGPRDWTLIGPEDGSASRASALQIGDVAGAKYAIAGGDYDLSFYKHVSAPDSYARAFYISGTNAGDSEPNFVVDNKLYNNGKYYYSDGGLLLKKMVNVASASTTTLLTIDSNGSYSCIGGGELLIVFVDPGSPWGVYVWKGLLTMRTVQFGSMYSSGIQMIDARNNLDGTFTVSSSTSKTSGVADGKLIVTATTSSGISGTAHVSFNGWTTGGAQPY